MQQRRPSATMNESSTKRKRRSRSGPSISSSAIILVANASSFLLLPLLLLFLLAVPRVANAAAGGCVTDLNICDGEGESYRPLPGCYEYALCHNGRVSEWYSCDANAIFDVLLKRCNWEASSFCIVQSCRPTPPPTTSPTSTPSESPSGLPSSGPSEEPSGSPSESPTETPSYSPSAGPTQLPTYDFFAELETDSMRHKFESEILVSYNPSGIAYPSTRYNYPVLIDSLREMVDGGGISSDGRMFRFHTGGRGGGAYRLDYGRTNLAAFLANAMTESISRDTCDEYGTDESAGRYAVTNACGQNGRSYQDEVCEDEDDDDGRRRMSCEVDVDMEMVSSGYATDMMGRAPPPFSCRPKASFNDFAGYWDARTGASSQTAYSNALGRTYLEGCCWWGRGALLTRGVCNIGKLNYYLGKRAYDERGEGRFPTIDFCADPEATCASEEGFESMRWITGLFEWIERVQPYPRWDYVDNLEKFVDGGMKDDSFIDTVSSIFTRNCHSDDDCSNYLSVVTRKEERRENFKRVLAVFGLPDVTAAPTTSRPRPYATPRPTTPRPFTPYPTRKILGPSVSVPQPGGGRPQTPPAKNNDDQYRNTDPPILWATPLEPPLIRTPPPVANEVYTADGPSEAATPTRPDIPTVATPWLSSGTERPIDRIPGDKTDNSLVILEDNSAPFPPLIWRVMSLSFSMYLILMY